MSWLGSSRGGGSTPPGDSPEQPGPGKPAGQDNAGWTIFSYLIAGMVVYGLIGWIVSRVTHMSVLFPVGAIAGLAVATVGIVYKYGRSS